VPPLVSAALSAGAGAIGVTDRMSFPRRIGSASTAVASYSALPGPMLARSGPLPTSGDYAYEVKWDGFRAIVSTECRSVSAAGAAGT
jgi:hypothetical protein